MQKLDVVSKIKKAQFARQKWRKAVRRKKIVFLKIQGRKSTLAALRVRPPENIILSGDRIFIKIPKVFSVSKNYEKSISCINSLRDYVLLHRKQVLIDFDDTEYVGVAAALILTSEIKRYEFIKCANGKFAINGTFPSSRAATKLLYDIGFFRALGIRRKSSDIDPSESLEHLHVGMHSFRKADPETIYKFSSVFTTSFAHFSTNAKQRLQGATIEALQNSFEHAFNYDDGGRRFGRRAWVSGYVNEQKHEFMLMVYDQGVGIPKTITETDIARFLAFFGVEWEASDSSKIEIATRLGETSTNQRGRGQGFKQMKRVLDSCDDGELYVYSNRGSYVYRANEKRKLNEFNASINGTLIQWRVRHTPADMGI